MMMPAASHSQPKAAVLLSIYNGRRFLPELLASVIGQREVDLTLYVRDDGSTDTSLEVVGSTVPASILRVLPSSHNVGVAASFMELLKGCGDCEIVAFCDQDDVWLPDKLARAWAHLAASDPEIPALYVCKARYVDGSLQDLVEPVRDYGLFSFANALVENQAPGCTMVFNRKARDLLVRAVPPPGSMLMHDWWVYLVISALGRLLIDRDYAGVLYRQHNANVVGTSYYGLSTLGRRVCTFLGSLRTGKLRASGQVEAFLRLYGDNLRPEERALAEGFVSARSSFLRRVADVARGRYSRSRKLERFTFAVQYLLGIY